MVRYIKDGAYTIVVDDTPAPKTASKKEGAPNDENSLGDHEHADRPPTEPEPEPEPEPEDEMGSNIDFTSPKFILQNLSIALPTYEDDRTHIMRGRVDVSKVMAFQIAFYVYCALQPFTKKPENTPQILLMGDGYVGTQVITQLASHGCTPLLRIYTRGDISAKEWRARGFQSGCNLNSLLKNQKPAIVVICADYSSFHMIYHQLREMEMLTPSTCVISCTLGFQRKKLFHNFKLPTIFRTYVEPQETVKSYRAQLRNKVFDLFKFDFQRQDDADEDELDEPDAHASGRLHDEVRKMTISGKPPLETIPQGSGSQVMTDTGAVEDDNMTHLTKSEADDVNSVGSSSVDNDDDDDDDNAIARKVTQPVASGSVEQAARNIVDRCHGVIDLLHLIENYYMLHEFTFAEARRMALRTMLGYISVQSLNNDREKAGSRHSRRSMRSRGSPSTPAAVLPTAAAVKRQQVVVKIIEKICLSLLSAIATPFHKEFSKSISVIELAELDEEPALVRLEMESAPELEVDGAGKHHFHKDDGRRLLTTELVEFYLSVDEDYSDKHGKIFDYMRSIDEADKMAVKGKKTESS